MSASICVITIYVPDMEEALHFYSDILGFPIKKNYGSSIVSLDNGFTPFILEEDSNFTYQTGGVVLALSTNNIENTVEFLKEKQVKFIIDTPTPCPPGRFIRIEDSFGNQLEFLEFEK